MDVPRTASGLYIPGQHTDDEDDFRSPDVKTVFAHFGLTYYHAEVLVHEIVNALVLARVHNAAEAEQRLQTDPWDKAFRDTMGNLVKRAGHHLQSGDPLIADLERAVAHRNRLAHGFWREHAEEFMSDAGRANMINRLCAMREHFERTDAEFAVKVTKPLMAKLGITQNMIQVAYNELADRATGKHHSSDLAV